MKIIWGLLAGIAAVALVTTSTAVYTVGEIEQAIITQFGKPVGEPIPKLIMSVMAFAR